MRLVNNEIRGALTTDAKSKINPATPRLADLTWTRLVKTSGLVDFTRTKLTDAGLKELAGLTSLQSLNLGSSQVTDAGLKGLAGLTSLQSLGLHGTQMTDAGLKELACNRCPFPVRR